MAGVSVQAFRRQGRRYGAGLVCSEMVSCAGIHYRNERTLGYLRIAPDERPLAVQIFGSEPALMAEAAEMVEAAGADIVDINFGCPVRKVTKTGAGATLLEQPERAGRIVATVADAVVGPGDREDAPWARERLAHLPGARPAAGGGRREQPHPSSPLGSPDVHRRGRSPADGRARRPGGRSRRRLGRRRRTTGRWRSSRLRAEAVMVGQAAQGNLWTLREIVDGVDERSSRDEVAAELIVFVRETARELGGSGEPGVPQEVLRLVPAKRRLSAAVRAGARAAGDDGRGRGAAAHRGARRRGGRGPHRGRCPTWKARRPPPISAFGSR